MPNRARAAASSWSQTWQHFVQVLHIAREAGDEYDAAEATTVDAELAHGGDVELSSGCALPRSAPGTSAAARSTSDRTGAHDVEAMCGATDAGMLSERALQRGSGRLSSTGRATVDRDKRSAW